MSVFAETMGFFIKCSFSQFLDNKEYIKNLLKEVSPVILQINKIIAESKIDGKNIFLPILDGNKLVLCVQDEIIAENVNNFRSWNGISDIIKDMAT